MAVPVKKKKKKTYLFPYLQNKDKALLAIY